MIINYFSKINTQTQFLNDGDVVTLKPEKNSKIYTIYGLGREENISFPQFASYGIVEVTLKPSFKLNSNFQYINKITEYSLLRVLCYLNYICNFNINNFINKNINEKLSNVNILKLEKIGKIDGKYKMQQI